MVQAEVYVTNVILFAFCSICLLSLPPHYNISFRWFHSLFPVLSRVGFISLQKGVQTFSHTSIILFQASVSNREGQESQYRIRKFSQFSAHPDSLHTPPSAHRRCVMYLFFLYKYNHIQTFNIK